MFSRVNEYGQARSPAGPSQAACHEHHRTWGAHAGDRLQHREQVASPGRLTSLAAGCGNLKYTPPCRYSDTAHKQGCGQPVTSALWLLLFCP